MRKARTEKNVPVEVIYPDVGYGRMSAVAQYMGCSLAQAYRLGNEGAIPMVRLRGMLLVPWAQLKASLSSRISGGENEQN